MMFYKAPRDALISASPGVQLGAWIQLVALLSFAALAMPFFCGRVYVGDDLGEFHLPLRNFYEQQLSSGGAFDWMPGLYGGFYVTGEGQLGAYHPLHLLLYRMLPLGTAFDLELLLNYPLLFAGTFLFLRRVLGYREAALYGALVFTFCSFSLLHFIHPNAMAVVAHIPWLLFAADVAVRADSRKTRCWGELAVGLLTASQLLLGYPQYVWLSLLIETAYVAWRTIGKNGAICRQALWLLAKCLGALAGAIQVLPTIDALGGSVRRVSDAAFASQGSMHPLNLLQLLAPYLFQSRVVGQNTHELGLYAGSVPLLLCVWLLVHHRQWGRFAPLVRASFVFAGLALLLAAGEFGGVYRLQTLLPLVNRFRFPCRSIVLFQLCIATNAAIALGLLVRAVTSPVPWDRKPGGRALLAVVIASIAAVPLGALVWPEYLANWPLVFCGPLLFAVGAALVALVERGHRRAFVALIVFTAIDLLAYGLSNALYDRTADLHEFVASISMPPSKSHDRVAAESNPVGLRVGDRMLLAGLQRADGYAGLEPAKRLDYTQRSTLEWAGVSSLLQTSAGQSRWIAISPTSPRARLVTRIAPPQVNGQPTTFDWNTAIVDGRGTILSGTPGTVRVLDDTPGRITLETDAKTWQILITTESFHSGWRAMVDGHPQSAVRVNEDFLGCFVPPGKHQVVLRFQPSSLRWGAGISACGLSLMGFAFFLRRFKAPATIESRTC